MTAPEYRRYGDREPKLQRTVLLDGAPVTLVVADTVVFRFQRVGPLGEDQGAVVELAATLTVGVTGGVEYDWPDGVEPLNAGEADPTDPVSFRLTVEATIDATGKVITTPERGNDIYIMLPRGP